MLETLYPYLGLTAGLMVGIIAVTYMIGHILNDKNLIGKARVWMGDFVENVIILLLVLGVYGASSFVSTKLLEELGVFHMLEQPSSDPLDLMLGYYKTSIKAVLHIMETAGIVYHSIEYTSHLTEAWGFPGVSVILNFYNGADYYSGPIQWAMRLGAIVYVSIQAQSLLLLTVKFLAYPLIVFSLVLRFLNVFRNAANNVIAIVLSYSVILPALYLILLAVYLSTVETQFGIHPLEPGSEACIKIMHLPLVETLSAFFPLIPYMGPCILDLFKEIAALGVAVIILPTFGLSVANAFVDALGYMLNLVDRSGMI